MNKEERFTELVKRARLESAPPVNVAGRAMAAILAAQARGDSRDEARPLLWIAGCSSAAAVAALLLLVVNGDAWTDPLATALYALTRGIL